MVLIHSIKHLQSKLFKLAALSIQFGNINNFLWKKYHVIEPELLVLEDWIRCFVQQQRAAKITRTSHWAQPFDSVPFQNFLFTLYWGGLFAPANFIYLDHATQSPFNLWLIKSIDLKYFRYHFKIQHSVSSAGVVPAEDLVSSLKI